MCVEFEQMHASSRIHNYECVLNDKREKTTSLGRAGCDSLVSFKAVHSYQSVLPLNRPLGS